MAQEYVEFIKTGNLPRLPLEGSIDLTYHCNNNCRHCWVRIPADVKEPEAELSFDQIRKIAEDARAMGCRQWAISGGEPMLRPDFTQIFDLLTKNSSSYTINTNGTLITPKIAKLMRRKGSKMVALYGATREVHDHITRNPGSFDAAMRGFAYLKEAGAGFIVQVIPMKDNFHQFKDMLKLSESLSKDYRMGAPWLYLSASGDTRVNKEIIRQRLSPRDVIELDKPDLSYEESLQEQEAAGCNNTGKGQYLFASCISQRRSFNIDPYGKMSFCCFIREARLLYDLKKGNFKECWEKFIPSLAGAVKGGKEYKQNCGSCNLKQDCRWCPVYAYLENRNFSSKVGYLCQVAKENRLYKDNWLKNHRRYYKIADITIQVDSDLPITDKTFNHKFKPFEARVPGEDNIRIRHHFSLPDLSGKNLGIEIYRKSPWAIYRRGDSWLYLGISSLKKDKTLHRVAVFNDSHTGGNIYNDKEDAFLKGNLHSLTLFPTDQILMGRVLADRGGFYLHSCGVVMGGKGLLFAGHSEAGKSTMAKMLKGKAKILCDDRIIVRKSAKGYNIYGTWSHGDVAEVSADSAPLKAIFFLEKDRENKVIRISDKKEITQRLLACLIKPFVTLDWWHKTLSVIDGLPETVPCYILRFDKSGKVVDTVISISTPGVEMEEV